MVWVAQILTLGVAIGCGIPQGPFGITIVANQVGIAMLGDTVTRLVEDA